VGFWIILGFFEMILLINMKFWAFLVFSLFLASARLDFHSQYVSRFFEVDSLNPILKASTCESFQCSSTPLLKNQCVFPSGTSNYLQVCPAGSFCPWALSTKYNTTCVTGSDIIEFGGNPGDQCNSNNDCGGLSTCDKTKGICVGLTSGQPCNDQGDCDVGYTCRNVAMSAVCLPMAGKGEKCGDYMSMNLCQNNLACNNGICTSVFSQPNGAVVSLESAALLCQSGFYTIGSKPSTAVCTAAPTSPSVTLPISCSVNSLCYSKDKKFTTSCECGFNSNGQGYCPLFPGDSTYQSFFSAFKNYLSSPNANLCHYLDLLMPTCPGFPYSQYEALESLMNEVQYFVSKLGNDRCVKTIITNKYWYG
jgi:hypothetical protein